MRQESSNETIAVVAPTPKFRRAAWALFQQKLDPLALPRPLPASRP